MSKKYTGCCGYCKYMELSSGYTFCYSTKFPCTRNYYMVKADEKACDKFEPDKTRTSDMIAKFDK